MFMKFTAGWHASKHRFRVGEGRAQGKLFQLLTPASRGGAWRQLTDSPLAGWPAGLLHEHPPVRIHWRPGTAARCEGAEQGDMAMMSLWSMVGRLWMSKLLGAAVGQPRLHAHAPRHCWPCTKSASTWGWLA